MLLLLALLALALPLAAQTNAPDAAPTPAATTAAANPAAPIDPAKDAEIRKMIQSSGIEATMKVVMVRVLETERARDYTLPAEFWNRAESEMDTADLANQLIPLYDRYYSLDDLKAINVFNASPAGQHMIAVKTQIATEAMKVGQQWGRSMAQKIMSEMEEEKVKAALHNTNAAPSPGSVQPPPPPAQPAAGTPGATTG
jgi:hypothetical protein